MKLQFLSKLPQKQTKTYAILAISFLLGCIMLIPSTSSDSLHPKELSPLDVIDFSLENEEMRLESILSNIEGVGECRVLLSVHSGSEAVLAEDNGETVVLKAGSNENIVTIQTIHPTYQGAVVVTGGCSNASVRHNVLASVSAYTGLSADKIAICPIAES